ncbi:hypothetical protein [Candidatus Electronema sp. JM]
MKLLYFTARASCVEHILVNLQDDFVRSRKIVVILAGCGSR